MLVMLDLLDVAFGYTAGIVADFVVVETGGSEAVGIVGSEAVGIVGSEAAIGPHTAIGNA